MGPLYFLKIEEQKIGPFDGQQIKDALRKKELNYFDLIQSTGSQSWVMIIQHPDFSDSEEFLGMKTENEGDHAGLELNRVGLMPDYFRTVNIQDGVPDTLQVTYWYAREYPSYPLRFLDVIKNMMEGRFNEHTLLGSTPEGPWRALVEWENFSSEAIEGYKKNKLIPDTVNPVRRRHERSPYGKYCLVLKNEKPLRVFCPEISLTGLSFFSESPIFSKKEMTQLKFCDHLADHQSDAKVEVVSCRKLKVIESETVFYRHSLRFIQVRESAWEYIRHQVKK